MKHEKRLKVCRERQIFDTLLKIYTKINVQDAQAVFTGKDGDKLSFLQPFSQE